MAEEKKILEIDDLLGKPKNRIAYMGVELEGGWTKLPVGARLEHDGSVFRGQEKVAGRVDGELPIGRFLPMAMPKAVTKYYPQVVDDTCGMHTHMSFQSLLHYHWLMTKAYPDTMIEYLKRWAKEEGFAPKHHIFERLAGKSLFCQDKYWPDEQIATKRKEHDQAKRGHRYTIVHYCGRQRTIEIRVLPMMDTAGQAVRGLQRILDITNACLMVLGKKEDRVREKVELQVEVIEQLIESEVELSAGQRRRLRA